MEQGSLKILALLPAYNEAAHLPPVLEQVKEQISDILVVDDGSSDGCADIARAAGVNVLARGFNLGKGRSLMEGYQWALERGYDAVIMLDADGQHDPKCIPAFISAYERTRASLIIGARDYSQMPLRRSIPNTIGRLLFSLAVGSYIPDNQSGYRLLDRDLMRRMLESKETGFHFEVEMIAICLAEGKSIEWVPIPTIYGDEVSRQNPLDQLFGFPAMCLQARRLVREKKRT